MIVSITAALAATHSELPEGGWIVPAAMLVFAAVALLGGWVAGRVSRRRQRRQEAVYRQQRDRLY